MRKEQLGMEGYQKMGRKGGVSTVDQSSGDYTNAKFEIQSPKRVYVSYQVLASNNQNQITQCECESFGFT
uniref:Uncharacterized protein n=1 Tax=Nelumbo nucifera TaxID=4432 RepID=A0A822XUG0_NELNU|nr:TPA_asm: hypothetical protein HUJ06_024846 [Nelumbo nucifera]